MGFGTMIWIVVLMSAPLAAALFVAALESLDDLGKGGLALEQLPARSAPRPLPRPLGPMAAAEREAEIRQMVQARHDRQARRGQVAVDVEAEVARLLALDPAAVHEAAAAGHDAALREEVRQLVIARNSRRAARGQEPLAVAVEVDRQLAALGAPTGGRADRV